MVKAYQTKRPKMSHVKEEEKGNFPLVITFLT